MWSSLARYGKQGEIMLVVFQASIELFDSIRHQTNTWYKINLKILKIWTPNDVWFRRFKLQTFEGLADLLPLGPHYHWNINIWKIKHYLSSITHVGSEIATSCMTTFLIGVPAVALTSTSTCMWKIHVEFWWKELLNICGSWRENCLSSDVWNNLKDLEDMFSDLEHN